MNRTATARSGCAPTAARPRFTAQQRVGGFVVHDDEDGSDTTPMRLSSAIHLAAQWNRQHAVERSEAQNIAADLAYPSASERERRAVARLAEREQLMERIHMGESS